MLRLGESTSLEKEAVPYVRRELKEVGYALLGLRESDEPYVTLSRCVAVMSVISRLFRKGISIAVLRGEGDPNSLPVHVEGIYRPTGIYPAFALGCVIAPSRGGKSRLFDARKAADILLARYPLLCSVKIRYGALAHPGVYAEYPVVVSERGVGRVLRYRSACETNDVISNDSGISAHELYKIINQIILECVIVEHDWSPGELMLVNNRFVLHDRTPYIGERTMVRMRIGEVVGDRLSY